MEETLKSIQLPSGAILKINIAPFADARALLQAVINKVQNINVPEGANKLSIMRKILASSLSSPEVDNCIWVCFKRCVYNTGVAGAADQKITMTTFESESARADYMTACVEVQLLNILPFLKGLSSELSPLAEAKESTPK